jgi:hypothetical protein
VDFTFESYRPVVIRAAVTAVETDRAARSDHHSVLYAAGYGIATTALGRPTQVQGSPWRSGPNPDDLAFIGAQAHGWCGEHRVHGVPLDDVQSRR